MLYLLLPPPPPPPLPKQPGGLGAITEALHTKKIPPQLFNFKRNRNVAVVTLRTITTKFLLKMLCSFPLVGAAAAARQQICGGRL